MTKPTLVVYGDEDTRPHLSVREAGWHADPYTLSPGPKDLLVIKGGKHVLGWISGWDVGETLDESPERLGALQRISWAYLWEQFYEGNGAWRRPCEVFGQMKELGRLRRRCERGV